MQKEIPLTNADRRTYLDGCVLAAFHEYCILPNRSRGIAGGWLGPLILAQFAGDLDNLERVLVEFEDAILKARQEAEGVVKS